MIKNILLACSILISLPVHSMKRLRERDDTNNSAKKMCLTFSPSLPFEIRELIIDNVIDNGGKLRSCIGDIKSFVQTNQQNYSPFHNRKYIDDLIEKLSKKFYCSHETVAKALSTPHAKDRLFLQTQLFDLCLKSDAHNIKAKFAKLIQQGVNVNFTYQYDCQPQTLLMIEHYRIPSIKYERKISPCFSLLLETSNFNHITPHNKTLLMKTVEYPIRYGFAKEIMQHKKTDINTQNYKGETALLYTIKNRMAHRMTHVFLNTIENLLLDGANPLIADKLGNTPLKAVYEIPDLSEMKDIVIELISKSIAKHEASGANPR